MSGPAPAPEGSVVAVVEKRGRFLMASPLFPASGERGPRQRRSDGQLVLDARGPSGRRANPGQLVLVAPARGGARTRAGAGHARILRVLGRPDVARDVLEALMLDRGLRRGFDPAVEREARSARDREREPRTGGSARHDLRELATFTIDPATARDFDDAISAQQIDTDRVRVWVHIADVAAHVGPGSLVDREAHRRATSVYVPGAVEPMLPEALSNDACSLVPGRDRLAVTVELVLSGATVQSAAFYRSHIRSDARLDYEQVDRIFGGQEPARRPWAESLGAARRAAAALQAARERRGALALDSVEPDFDFDPDGHVLGVRARVQSESHRVIENLMISANEAVARLLAERRAPCLYRVHERPDPERVLRLVDQLASLGVATPPVGDLLSPSQAAALVVDISRQVQAHVRRSGQGRIALTSLVLRSLKQAHYSPKNLGHTGLGSTAYCHFTSPIRRYPDLVCHRALLAAVGGGEIAPAASGLHALGAWTSDRERAAMVIERDADDVARCFALERLLFTEGFSADFAGEVTGLIGAGAFVAFSAGQGPVAASTPSYEGMLPVRRMSDLAAPGEEREWWELNEQGTILQGMRNGSSLRLGDRVSVRVHRVDAVRGRVDLEPAPGARAQPAARPDRAAGDGEG